MIGTVANGTTDVTGVPAVIRYPLAGEAQAKTVQAYINGETKLQESPDSGGVELVLIQQFGGVADATTAQGKLSQPTPSQSGPGCSPTATGILGFRLSDAFPRRPSGARARARAGTRAGSFRSSERLAPVAFTKPARWLSDGGVSERPRSTPRKRVWGNSTVVRIPPPPPGRMVKPCSRVGETPGPLLQAGSFPHFRPPPAVSDGGGCSVVDGADS